MDRRSLTQADEGIPYVCGKSLGLIFGCKDKALHNENSEIQEEVAQACVVEEDMKIIQDQT